ncbi:hypothetical protein EDD21DRAFT_193230 [Dissophora ornata]|nr:hypothetical protein EDD21DRAFT_193230 [Dissophora ornata]
MSLRRGKPRLVGEGSRTENGHAPPPLEQARQLLLIGSRPRQVAAIFAECAIAQVVEKRHVVALVVHKTTERVCCKGRTELAVLNVVALCPALDWLAGDRHLLQQSLRASREGQHILSLTTLEIDGDGLRKAQQELGRTYVSCCGNQLLLQSAVPFATLVIIVVNFNLILIPNLNFLLALNVDPCLSNGLSCILDLSLIILVLEWIHS